MRGFELPREGFPVSLFDQTVDLRGDQSLVLTQNLGVIVNSLTPGPAERIVKDQCICKINKGLKGINEHHVMIQSVVAEDNNGRLITAVADKFLDLKISKRLYIFYRFCKLSLLNRSHFLYIVFIFLATKQVSCTNQIRWHQTRIYCVNFVLS